jgi:hypothetical protein
MEICLYVVVHVKTILFYQNILFFGSAFTIEIIVLSLNIAWSLVWWLCNLMGNFIITLVIC